MRRACWPLLVLAALAFAPAFAADAVVSWTHPILNVDGTSIPASGSGAIASTRVEWGSCSGTAFGTKSGEATVAYPTATVAVPGLAVGKWCFRAFSRNGAGVDSLSSGVASKTIAPAQPQPPTALTIALAGQISGGGAL